jgi:lipopolysaccharide biosynthesis protein
LKKIRPIALYLPQFHPIPENDAWWGEGFTEWTKVKKAVPLFKGHYQPHVPHEDIGYYDLRNPEVMVNQAEMAKENGIYGFCFYHYWFNGKRLLDIPIENMYNTGKPDFPYCLCWANENWTRRWDGLDKEILIKQDYNYEDDRNHIKFLFKFFNDNRYIKVNGKPLFIIYKPGLFPNIRKTIEIWRKEAIKANLGELYLCYFEDTNNETDPELIGFDAAIEFQPNWKTLEKTINSSIIKRVLRKIKNPLTKPNIVFNYEEFSKINIKNNKIIKYKRYPSVFPMWDNSARKKEGAIIFKESSPELYYNWLNETIINFQPFSDNENFIFINAWNEWAEGNHLEPCEKWGKQYLERTFEAISINNISLTEK